MLENLVNKVRSVDPQTVKKVAVVAGAAIGTVIVALVLQRAAASLNGLEVLDEPVDTDPMAG